jgi:hypothetical protein
MESLDRVGFAFVMSVVLLLHSLVGGSENQLTADDVLRECAATLASISRRFAIEAESWATSERNYGKTGHGMTQYYYRRDGSRLDIERISYPLNADGKPSTSPSFRNRAIINSEGQAISYFGAGATPKEVLFTADGTKEIGYTQAQMQASESLDGNLARDQVSFVELFPQARELKLHPLTEDIRGSQCYLLEALTDHGAYKVWLDPAYGYLPRKAIVRKRGSDVFDHKPLTETYLSEVDFVLDAVEIQRVDGRFVPVACELEETWRRRDGRVQTTRTTHKRTHIDFEPDFEAMGAFKPDIPNGTRVNYQDFMQTGLAYEWMNGKIVPAVDDSALTDIDTFLDDVKQEGVSLPRGSVRQSSSSEMPNSPNESLPSAGSNAVANGSIQKVASERSGWIRIVLTVAVGGALLAAAFITFRFHRGQRG